MSNKPSKYTLDDYFIQWRYTSVPGTFVAELVLKWCAWPVGSVWYRDGFHDGVIEICGSYVPDNLRRHGIRTAIHQWMLAMFPKTKRIITRQATEDSRPWLIKMGFNEVKSEGYDEPHWQLDIKPSPPLALPTP